MSNCCFVGHKKIPQKDYANIQSRLKAELITLIQQGVECFYTGGATGFDSMAAISVLRLKTEFPHIRLVLVLPCKEKTESRLNKGISLFNYILGRSDLIVYASENYQRGCMAERSRQLVNISKFCLCYLTKNIGGTVHTVGYARQSGLRIINLA